MNNKKYIKKTLKKLNDTCPYCKRKGIGKDTFWEIGEPDMEYLYCKNCSAIVS
jgi:hypothetical protein